MVWYIENGGIRGQASPHMEEEKLNNWKSSGFAVESFEDLK